MPELPEVETIRADLEEKLIGKKIKKLEIKKPKMIKSEEKEFFGFLLGASFISAERIGKLLIFALQKNKIKKYLLVHLKMTGQLIYVGAEGLVAGGHSNSKDESRKYRLGGLEKDLPNKFSHIIFRLSDSSTLYFNDMRQFGYVKLASEEELAEIKSLYGIEPLQKNFHWRNFKKIFAGKKSNIKAMLLNQNIVSGLGNIYVDEVLFASGIMPTRTAASLDEEELRKIFANTKKIIKKAIKYRGTTFSDYVDSRGRRGNFSDHLLVYGKQKQVCPTCRRSKILKIKVAGRGTCICPRCQN